MNELRLTREDYFSGEMESFYWETDLDQGLWVAIDNLDDEIDELI